MITQILTYPLRAWHRHGFDVQSPWAYEMVCDVLFEPLRYYAYDQLSLLRKVFTTEVASATDMDEQLFRLANHTSPSLAIEFGSPISACYMARPHSSTHCIAVVPHISDTDSNTLQQLGIEVHPPLTPHLSPLTSNPSPQTSHLSSLTPNLSPQLVQISSSCLFNGSSSSITNDHIVSNSLTYSLFICMPSQSTSLANA
ncbi:MAG: hypothetical protein II240_00140, partial [Bacteroidaceae bacterium]|nr:hypothetical protein [Bacteroidaceae bacterium]